MSAKPRTIVGDLADWDLPSLDDRIFDLAKKLEGKTLQIDFDDITLGELLDRQLYDEVLALGATAANEAIMGWLQGVADGCPELCTEFPYLQGDDEAEPLTVIYSVGARDGSRAEINRIDLAHALLKVLESDESSGQRMSRATVMASRLRTLAEKLEKAVAA
jgi:hypothetical protein